MKVNIKFDGSLVIIPECLLEYKQVFGDAGNTECKRLDSLGSHQLLDFPTLLSSGMHILAALIYVIHWHRYEWLLRLSNG